MPKRITFKEYMENKWLNESFDSNNEYDVICESVEESNKFHHFIVTGSWGDINK